MITPNMLHQMLEDLERKRESGEMCLKEYHYRQIGLGTKKHCDMKNKIGYLFVDCPACKKLESRAKAKNKPPKIAGGAK